MSLYGYGLAQYVVESSLGVPTGCAGKLRWQTAGMFGEAAMAEPWDGVGKAAMAGTHKAPLNSIVVISWHTHWKCVRVLIGTMSIQLSEDNHDSW
jgi:hypothetical protein